MNTDEASLETQIHIAEIDRSFALVAQVWESDEELSVDDMCKHLEAIGDIVDKTSTFGEFVESANLSGRERLN